MRILLALAKYNQNELTVYKIAKFSGLDRKAIKRHIHKLVEANLVRTKMYGPLFVYSLNDDNMHVQKIVDLFNEARLLVRVPTDLHWTDFRP